MPFVVRVWEWFKAVKSWWKTYTRENCAAKSTIQLTQEANRPIQLTRYRVVRRWGGVCWGGLQIHVTTLYLESQTPPTPLKCLLFVYSIRGRLAVTTHTRTPPPAFHRTFLLTLHAMAEILRRIKRSNEACIFFFLCFFFFKTTTTSGSFFLSIIYLF